MYDVLIIGAGVCGCAIARELSKRKLNIAVLESASDICEGTSKANSGIVHAGYDAVPGSLKAKLNLEGSRMMEELSKELDFPYRKNGALVLCFDENDKDKLTELYYRGQQNKVEDLQLLSPEEILELEPNVSKQVTAALYAPTSAVVCPFGLTIALAENAVVNGVTFFLDTRVTGIEKHGQTYMVTSAEHAFESRIIINAAGVYADEIHNMICTDQMEIAVRRGEYLLFDKNQKGLIFHTLFQLPTSLGKGVLMTPTVHGNLLAGPTAEDISDKEGVNTTQEGIQTIIRKAGLSINNWPGKSVITSFAGLRAHTMSSDFIIGEAEGMPGFIDAAGIESPGLSAAPAIAAYVACLVQEILPAEAKEDFMSERKGIISMQEASEEERSQLIAKRPEYAKVICRCELVTEGEVLDAIHRPLGARTIDGVKRRVRAGMGRCQSGFCSPHIISILAREYQCDKSEITKCGGASFYLEKEERT